MPYYSAHRLGRIEAETIEAAAQRFAQRIARRKFGPSGRVRVMRLIEGARDQSDVTYDIAVSKGAGEAEPVRLHVVLD